MIDFACKQFDLNDIIKCGLGLTKAEYKVMEFFISNLGKKLTSNSVSKSIDLNLTTVQKAVKKLSDKKVIIKYQINLDNGGYVYLYVCNLKVKIRSLLKDIINNWAQKVETSIDQW